MIEKPPLDETYLIHVGVKGMKWGKRKTRPDEAERKKFFAKGSTSRKVAIGAAVVGGTLAVGFILSKRGRTKIGETAVSNFVLNRQRKSQQGQSPFGDLAKRFRDTKAASVPSPDQMIADARMAGVRDRVFKGGSQKLTEQAWRDQARLGQLNRSMQESTNNLLNGNIRAMAEARRGA